MEDKQIVNYKHRKGVTEIYPAHPLVNNWLFTEDEEEEAVLANFMATVAEKNGLTCNDIMHIFPVVLRILKSKSVWAK